MTPRPPGRPVVLWLAVSVIILAAAPVTAAAARCRRPPCLVVLPALDATPPPGAVCLGSVCVSDGLAPPAWAYNAAGRHPLWLRPARYRLRLDQAAPAAGADLAREQLGLTGQGVWLAVIDTGLDWRHSDFLTKDGHSRVAWLLDQTLPPRGVYPELEQLGGGAVFSRAELERALAGDLDLGAAGDDVSGHGTHVAGIAASGDAHYQGVAPALELVAVKAVDPQLGGVAEDRLLRGLAFADRVAQRAGRPLVVNLSLGNQMGAHDGSEPLELALSELATRPGRAVVVAAGNEGGWPLHARARLEPGRPLRLGLLLPAAGPVPRLEVVVDIWAAGTGAPSLVVETPLGERSWAVGGSGPRSFSGDTGAGFIESECAGGRDWRNGLWRCQVRLSNDGGLAPAAGRWVLELSGSSQRLDAWLGEFELGGPWPEFTDHIDPGCLVGPPATAQGVLAVGSYTNRVSWTDAAGRRRQVEGSPGERSWFTVIGPTRDGRFKPELLAPGWLVISTLSSASDPRRPDSLFYSGGDLGLVAEDGRHALAGGTSMAAPLAAGAAALLLEQNPGLTGAEITRSLALAARRQPGDPRARFRPEWGFGRLWLPAALTPGQPQSGPVAPERSLCGVSRWWLAAAGDRVWAVAVPRDGQGRPLPEAGPVSITAAGLSWAGPIEHRGGGLWVRPLDVAPEAGRRVYLDCACDGVRFSARPFVQGASGYLEVFGTGPRALGCTSAGAVPRPGVVLPLLLAAWLAGRRRRGLSDRNSPSNCRTSKIRRRSRPSWE